jgi:hypothetical protein
VPQESPHTTAISKPSCDIKAAAQHIPSIFIFVIN